MISGRSWKRKMASRFIDKDDKNFCKYMWIWSIILKKDDIADLTFRRFASGFFSNYFKFYLNTDCLLAQLKILLLVFVATFFTLIIINLYRLIIVTSSPNNLKIQKENFQDLIGHYIVKFILLFIIFIIIFDL